MKTGYEKKEYCDYIESVTEEIENSGKATVNFDIICDDKYPNYHYLTAFEHIDMYDLDYYKSYIGFENTFELEYISNKYEIYNVSINGKPYYAPAVNINGEIFVPLRNNKAYTDCNYITVGNGKTIFNTYVSIDDFCRLTNSDLKTDSESKRLAFTSIPLQRYTLPQYFYN